MKAAVLQKLTGGSSPPGKRLTADTRMVKTNVMRLLDAARIPYETGTYEVDENDLSAVSLLPGGLLPPVNF